MVHGRSQSGILFQLTVHEEGVRKPDCGALGFSSVHASLIIGLPEGRRCTPRSEVRVRKVKGFDQ
jgi:hypothetical protein